MSLDPKVDVGQVSLKADLDALAALTTQTGRGIIAIEDWLLSLRDWSKKVKALVKAGQAGQTLEEVAEIKYHIATAKMVRYRFLPFRSRGSHQLLTPLSLTGFRSSHGKASAFSLTVCNDRLTELTRYSPRRIREGAQQEAFRRERTRIWMARHIRHREPDIEDSDVRKLLKAAELGAADGIQECPVT